MAKPKSKAEQRAQAEMLKMMKGMPSGMEVFSSQEEMKARAKELDGHIKDPDAKQPEERPQGLFPMSKEDELKEGSWQLKEFGKRFKAARFHPTDADEKKSLVIAMEVRCDVCRVLADNALKKATSYSEDDIMDQFEADPHALNPLEPLPSNSTQQENQDWRVESFKKGCNRLFKDIRYEGWEIERCALAGKGFGGRQVDKEAKLADGKMYCIQKLKNPPEENDVEIYSEKNEAMYHACAQTIGMYGQEVASSLEKVLTGKKKRDPYDAIPEVCLKAAKCDTYSTKRDKQSQKNRKKAGKAQAEADRESRAKDAAQRQDL